MGMRNTFDRKKVSEAPPIDKTLGTAFDTVKSLADKLPIIEYLDKNVDGLVADMKNSQATAVAAANQAVASEVGAKGSADAAKLSEDAAHASELAAAQSASDLVAAVAQADADALTATQKAQAASDSAAAALLSEQHSAASAQASLDSQNAAKASEDAAKLSEDNAKASEQQSAQNLADTVTAKNAAAQSEVNAKASEDSAELSETNAIDAEQAAFASQTAAATSEDNAKTSEQGAASSLAQAQAIVKTLNQLYLGAKSADPTTDNNGDPLIVGAEYFNTTTNQLRVYAAGGWQDQDATAETMAANATASAAAAAGSAQAALDSQNAAKTSEDNAKTSETNSGINAANALTRSGAALQSAQDAAGSAQAASDSKTAAATSEGNSAASASLAQDWAVKMDTQVGGVDYSAKYWANQAKISAQSITYPIPTSNGGVGRTSLTANAVVVGDGTNPVKQVGPGTNGQMLLGSTGDTPVWGNNATINGGTIDNTPIGDTTPRAGTFNGFWLRNANPVLAIDDVGGGWPVILFRKNGVQRWGMYGEVTDATPSFYLNRYNSDGSYASKPFSIDWVSRVLTLEVRPTWAGYTPWDSNNLVAPWTAGNLANPMTLDTAQTVTGAKTFNTRPLFGTATPWDSSNLASPMTLDTAQTVAGAKTFSAAATFAGITSNSTTNTLGSGATTVLELGAVATTGSYLDFHSVGGAGNDYDLRIYSTGGTAGTPGRGAANYVANTHAFTGAVSSNTNITLTSDERLKKNWQPLPADIVDKVALITKNGTFERTDIGGRFVGGGAQSWQALIPESVRKMEDGTLSMDYAGVAVAMVVELCREVKELRGRLAELEDAE